MNASAIAMGPRLSAAVAMLQAAGLPTEDLTEAHCEHFFFSGPDADPDGLVGLELFGDAALLRSLVVPADRRGRGSGSELLAHAERYATERGVRRIYLLTTSAESFFAQRGYTRAARDSAPEAIRASREFSGLCPASAAFMSKLL
jgi:amino-acid N-acetyltransferase